MSIAEIPITERRNPGMDILLIRHGESHRSSLENYNPEKLCPDPLLTDNGRKQAEQLARKLAGKGIDAIYGIIVVTSPQEPVSMIVTKAVRMAEMMNIPVIGLVENMSYYKCPDCGSEHNLFGNSHIDEIAGVYDLNVLARLPVDPGISSACDKGMIELFGGDWLDPVAEILEKQ